MCPGVEWRVVKSVYVQTTRLEVAKDHLTMFHSVRTCRDNGLFYMYNSYM